MPAPQTDRRQLLRAGVWTVPVVAMAAAAPAFAGSGADMRPSTGTATSPNGTKPITVTLTITNGGTADTTLLRVSITAPNAVLAAQSGPNGWTLFSASGNTVIFDANSELGAGATMLPTPTVFVIARQNSASGTVTIEINPGAGGVSDVIEATI